jgi:hypothetical protein
MKVLSLAGLPKHDGLVTARSFRSPHQTLNRVALIGEGNIPRPGDVDTSTYLLLRGSFRLLRLLPLRLLLLFGCLLFLVLLLILLAFVSHCVSPLPFVPPLFAATTPMHRQVGLGVPS